MNKKFIYGVSSLMLLSGVAFTSCQSEEDLAGVSGQKVLLTVTANKEGGTRTAFSPDGAGNLGSVWTKGDQLVVVDGTGKIGVVTLEGEGGESTGLFKGEVELGSNKYINIIYLGKDGENEKRAEAVPTGEKSVSLDISAQNDNLASLADCDVMYAQTVVENINGSATANVVEMNRYVAEGYFDLQIPDVTLEAGDQVVISSTSNDLYKSFTMTMTGDMGFVKNVNSDKGNIVITKTAEMGNKLYVTMIPQTVAPKFTVIKSGMIYTATLDSHAWTSQTFVHDGAGNAVPVTNWTVTEAPVDLGDMGNWGGVTTPINMDDSGSLDRLYTSGGYVNNDYSIYINAGFAQPITFYANGVTNGYLYSTSVESPSYYQWGRWLGFPAEIGQSPELNAYGQAGSGSLWASALMIPGKLAQTTSWTYVNTQNGSIPAGQFYRLNPATWTGGWDAEMSKKAAHMYAIKTTLPSSSFCDYLKTNEQCSWEARSGNPCPDGWRIPTIAELRILIPSAGSVSGSYAEVKTINGANYAMKWVVGKNSKNIASVKITSVKTDKTSVSVNDAIFDSSDASILEIVAYGITSNTGELNYKGQRAYVWASESATASSLSGYAGAALRIIFSGTQATFGMAAQDRINGCNIIPVRDAKAKATPLKPWFPSDWHKYI